MCTYKHVDINTYTQKYMYTYMHEYKHVHVCTWTHITHIHIYESVRMCICTFAFTYLQIRSCVFINTHAHIHTRTQHTHTLAYTFTYAYIHIYICTHIQKQRRSPPKTGSQKTRLCRWAPPWELAPEDGATVRSPWDGSRPPEPTLRCYVQLGSDSGFCFLDLVFFLGGGLDFVSACPARMDFRFKVLGLGIGLGFGI